MGKLLTLSFALVGLRNAISRRRTACTKRDLTEVPDGMVRQAGGSIGDSNFEVGVVTAGQAAAASAGATSSPISLIISLASQSLATVPCALLRAFDRILTTFISFVLLCFPRDTSSGIHGTRCTAAHLSAVVREASALRLHLNSSHHYVYSCPVRIVVVE